MGRSDDKPCLTSSSLILNVSGQLCRRRIDEYENFSKDMRALQSTLSVLKLKRVLESATVFTMLECHRLRGERGECLFLMMTLKFVGLLF